jgi:hypothetical protein
MHNPCDSSSSTITIGSTYPAYNWNTGATTQGISVNTSGTFSVTVTNTSGCTGTASIVVNSNCNLPTFPANPTANIATTSAVANWIAPGCYYGYTIRISKHNTNNWTNHIITPNTHYSFSGLTHNTTYDWQIQTNCNASGTINSGFSASQTFTTLARLGDGIANADQSDNNDNALNVYPNPTKDQITIAFVADKEDACNIRLIDVTGRIILTNDYTDAIGENQYQMDLSQLAKGIYVLILQSQESTLQTKVVVQ